MAPLARNGDFWSGLVLAALGAYIVGQARAWDYMTEDGPGAGFFPAVSFAEKMPTLLS